MEISPVTGVRLMLGPKAMPVDPQLTALVDIERAARPDDDTYTSNRRKAAGAEENDEDSDEESEQLEEILDDDLPTPVVAAQADEWPHNSPDGRSSTQISFFA